MYLATAAYLGSDSDLENDELRIKDQASLRELSPTVVELFESDDWVYPVLMWPDGNYPHAENVTTG